MKIARYDSLKELGLPANCVKETSGFLGGRLRGGAFVVSLEEEWAKKFGSKHAIACNSATSGLMAAVKAASVKLHKDRMLVSVPCFTMSATAAAPAILGNALYFEDCEDEAFCIKKASQHADIAIVTNLFGHPAPLRQLRRNAVLNGQILIEDNAQSVLATEYNQFTGTIGHIGVFSLNVHKHIQAGEGGVCVTDDDELAHYMRMFINHAEMFPDSAMIGLNLRMTELTAFVALQQLRKVEELVLGRQLLASAILESIGDIPGLKKTSVRDGCRHAGYAVPFLVEKNRKEFVEAVRLEGVPLVEGYVNPLNRMPAFSKWAGSCPVAEDLHDRRLFYWENCAWDPTEKQVKEIGKAFRKAAEKVELI